MKSIHSNKPIWAFPWYFVESIFVVVGLYLTGMALQLFLGSFKFAYIAWPLNLILGVVTILVVFLLSLKKESKFFAWLSAAPFSICLICLLIVQSIIMGIFPQEIGVKMDETRSIADIVGFTKMTSSWPFVISLYATLIALFAAIVNRLKMPQWRDYAFYLNHIGLFVLLFAAGFGSADLKRYVMYVEEDEETPEWRVYSESNDVLELPIAIKLNDFLLEEYAPKLSVISRKTGKALPEDAPDFFQIDRLYPQGRVSDWNVKLKTYIEDAVRQPNQQYEEIHMPGSCPAAYVFVENTRTHQLDSGWTSCGNFAQLYKVINLDENHSLVMTRPEPKRFASDIEVYTQSGEMIRSILEVNKPLKVGSWTIYQYGYDNDAGKASTYSSFELVYDPWLNVVYVGIVLFAIGSLCLFWIGYKKRKEKENEFVG